ncbi:tyrosine recombinase XerC [Tsukamurella sp. 1534]|uniref:site-specific integrase n=1 Tax=Tsukamurella sp. 1534 TaxID=1151061 RepID=UPI0002E0A6DE|nr:tyrosine-type recombinase/integrase [Tsukamurella sp. 1534]
MARPPLPIGTHGTITRTEVAPGRWQALAKVRDHDGRTRRVKRYGKTGAAAERALKEALRDRAKRTDHVDEISRDTTLEDLARLWIERRVAENELSPGTIDGYRDLIRVHIVPGVGGIRIGEVTVGKLDRFIRAVPGATSSQHCRVVLSGMLKLAAQHDAIDFNPVRDTTLRHVDRGEIRTLTDNELEQLRTRVDVWAGGNRMGPKRGQDIANLTDIMLGASTRIGEALAIREDDIDLGTWGQQGVPVGEQRPPTVTISGTIDRYAKRQPWTKTDAGWRTVVLPDFTAEAIVRQLALDLPQDEDRLLFPGRHGGPRNTHNVRTQLRKAWRTVVLVDGVPDGPEDMFDWVKTHTLRKTSATVIDDVAGLQAAADQLGHASTDVTRKHYVPKAATAPDLRHALDRLARRRPTTP